ncbi:MAG: hypothetical protein JNK87_23655 [Bryobacterales bacterium]|nr:hypothetical protein [Bryobacterales bacterium]
MGRQIQIYFSPEDVRMFENAAKEQLGGVVLAHRQPASQAESIRSTVSKNADGVWSFGYLVRAQDLGGVVLRHIPAQGYWVVDETRSPVVELDGGFDDGTILRRGRLYFQKGFYGENGQWIDKPQIFLEWAEEILKLAKKLSRRDQKLEAYVGPSAVQKQSSGCVLVAS